ncbi:hypothetical protein ACRAWD_12160 [Caulobacter segnis]
MNAGHAIETSLGYYINPLMGGGGRGAAASASGIGREGAWVAIGCATIGVAIQTAALGHLCR